MEQLQRGAKVGPVVVLVERRQMTLGERLQQQDAECHGCDRRDRYAVAQRQTPGVAGRLGVLPRGLHRRAGWRGLTGVGQTVRHVDCLRRVGHDRSVAIT